MLCISGNLQIPNLLALWTSISQRGGRRLSKNCAIGCGEASKLRKPIAGRDLRNFRCCRTRPSERVSHQVQAPQPNIPAGTGAEDIKAAHSQGSFRHTHRLAQHRHGQLPVKFCRQNLLEPIHNFRATSSRSGIAVYDIRSHAVDECVNNIVFDGAGDFPVRDSFGACLDETASLGVKPPQLIGVNPWGPQDLTDRRRDDFRSGERLAGMREEFWVNRYDAPAAGGSARALMHALTDTVKHQILRFHFCSAPNRWRPGKRKRKIHRLWRQRDIGGARQAFL